MSIELLKQAHDALTAAHTQLSAVLVEVEAEAAKVPTVEDVKALLDRMVR
jgi:hypothetical protein